MSLLSLPNLPINIFASQIVYWEDEILILGGMECNRCYSYHLKYQQYREICKYPDWIKLSGHCVVDMDDTNRRSSSSSSSSTKEKKILRLLSFGGVYKHTLMMHYQSVWDDTDDNDDKQEDKDDSDSNDNEDNDDNDDDDEKEKNKNKKKKKEKEKIYKNVPKNQKKRPSILHNNQWVSIPSSRNGRNIIIGKENNDNWSGARAVLSGKDGNLLFVTHAPRQIVVIDIKTFECVIGECIPLNDNNEEKNGNEIQYHCFVPWKGYKNQFLLIGCQKMILITYDEKSRRFTFTPLSSLPKLDSFIWKNFHRYGCVVHHENEGDQGVIVLFGGMHFPNISRDIYLFSMASEKWYHYPFSLPVHLCDIAAVVDSHHHVHLIGGRNNDREEVKSHYVMPLKPQFFKSPAQIVRNALVIVIEINKYQNNNNWPNLPRIQKYDKSNFISIFEKEMNYDVCYSEDCLTKQELFAFISRIKKEYELIFNKKNYDALIVSILGYGEDKQEDAVIVSDGQSVFINDIINEFDAQNLQSFNYLPKIFLVDLIKSSPQHKKLISEHLWKIWSEPQDFMSPDFGYFSEYLLQVKKEKQFRNELCLKDWIINTQRKIRQECSGYGLQIEMAGNKQIYLQQNFDEKDASVEKPFNLSSYWKDETTRTKVIKNALVIMIGISKYKTEPKILWSVSRDMLNFKELFETEFKYKFVCNSTSNLMNKNDVIDFVKNTISKNLSSPHLYDGILFVVCGKGKNHVLITSNDEEISIEDIGKICVDEKQKQQLPIIFFIDISRGSRWVRIIGSHSKSGKICKYQQKLKYDFEIKQETYFGHPYDEFITICCKTDNIDSRFSDYPLKFISNIDWKNFYLDDILLQIQQKYSTITIQSTVSGRILLQRKDKNLTNPFLLGPVVVSTSPEET